MTNQTRTLVILGAIPVVLAVMLMTRPEPDLGGTPADRVRAEAPAPKPVVESPPMPATLKDIIRTAPHTRQGLTQLVTTYEKMSPEDFAETYSEFEERFALTSVHDIDVIVPVFLRLKDEHHQIAASGDTTMYDRAMTLLRGAARAVNQADDGPAAQRATHELCKALTVWKREIKTPEAIYDLPLMCE
jgi:hypothetical protein